jgi:alanine dehydrogenase
MTRIAGLNVHGGAVTYKAVADDLGVAFKPAAAALG